MNPPANRAPAAAAARALHENPVFAGSTGALSAVGPTDDRSNPRTRSTSRAPGGGSARGSPGGWQPRRSSPRPARVRALQAETNLADLDDVAEAQGRHALDRRSVDERSVRAAEIFQE